ncbi:MAG: ornithine carbamoyltransferase [Firmicutes bacterium]|nr:ornithine carbamoyltransferase [Bacillota bacterium]
MKNLLSLLDISSEELLSILNRADQLEYQWKTNDMPQVLKNQQVGLWFLGQGFRNRVAFEIGARAMGASVSYIPGEIGIHEPLEDIGHYLDKWFSILVIRAKRHSDLLKLTETTNAAIINARTNFNHPCEILGDLQFIRKYRGGLDDLSLVFVGEVTNLCMSWFNAAVKLPISVTQVAPDGYGLDNERLIALNENAVGKITVCHELEPLLEKADVLYTDCWPVAKSDEDTNAIKNAFLPYQINSNHLSKLHSKAVFLPCPPVTRGQEVSFDSMLSRFCKSQEAKQFLLHSQNAVLEFITAT